jgi:hypothetical protein
MTAGSHQDTDSVLCGWPAGATLALETLVKEPAVTELGIKRIAKFIRPFRVPPGTKLTLEDDYGPAFKAGAIGSRRTPSCSKGTLVRPTGQRSPWSHRLLHLECVRLGWL